MERLENFVIFDSGRDDELENSYGQTASVSIFKKFVLISTNLPGDVTFNQDLLAGPAGVIFSPVNWEEISMKKQFFSFHQSVGESVGGVMEEKNAFPSLMV
jgi:hypothetical protein